jgi:hypothetical protein
MRNVRILVESMQGLEKGEVVSVDDERGDYFVGCRYAEFVDNGIQPSKVWDRSPTLLEVGLLAVETDEKLTLEERQSKLKEIKLGREKKLEVPAPPEPPPQPSEPNDVDQPAFREVKRELRRQIIDVVDDEGKVDELTERVKRAQTPAEFEELVTTLEPYKLDLGKLRFLLDSAKKTIVKRLAKEKQEGLKLTDGEIKALLIHLGRRDAGILNIDEPLLQADVEAIMRVVFQEEQKILFLQSPSTKIKGKIINVEWAGKIEMPIAIGYSRIVKTKEEGEFRVYKVIPYYEKVDGKTLFGWHKIAEITDDVYGYRIYDEENDREVLGLSRQKIELSELEEVEGFEGLLIQNQDDLNIGKNAKLKSFLPIIHITKSWRRVPPYVSIQALMREAYPRLTDANSIDGVAYHLLQFYRHPSYYEELIMSILLSGKAEYPLHFFILQDGSGGKTTMLNRIMDVMGLDENDIWTGEDSTIKSLIPNYQQDPPDCGFMAKCRVLGLLDEFFGREQGEGGHNMRRSEYAGIKNILEHRKGKGRSGKGDVMINPTAQFLFCTNQKYGVVDLASLMEKTDYPFVERMLIYFYTDMHYKFIEERRMNLRNMEFVENPEMKELIRLSILHFKSFTVKGIQVARIDAIRKHLTNLLKIYDNSKAQLVQKYIDARLEHHMFLLLDGIVKLRCLTQLTFEPEKCIPEEQDYKKLNELMSIIAKSWVSSFDINDFSVDARVRLLSGRPRELYHWIKENNGHILESDLISYALSMLKYDPNDVAVATKQLEDWNVITHEGGHVNAYWWKDRQQRDTEQLERSFAQEHKDILMFVQMMGQATLGEIRLEFASLGEQKIQKVLDDLKRAGKLNEFKKSEFKATGGT